MQKMIKTKKKGFTLIELLAVIVVLAILALIAVPIVLNIIKDARNNSNKRSIESYVRSIEYAISEHLSENPDQEIVTWEDVKDRVEYKGKVECQWGENLSSISSTGEITLHGCKVNNKTNSIYGYVDGKVVEEKKEEDNENKEEIEYTAYNVGDEITYKGINFYVIAPSDTKQEYVTLLKAEPLTSSETTAYGSTSTSTSHGSTSTSTVCGGAYYDNTDPKSTNYDDSDIKKVVEAWSKAKLTQSELKEDSLGYKVRLITFDELTTNLGYSLKTGDTSYTATADVTPSWVYNSNYWYWTMSQSEDSTSSVWRVDGYGRLSNGSVYYNAGVVRPVINLLKSAI